MAPRRGVNIPGRVVGRCSYLRDPDRKPQLLARRSESDSAKEPMAIE